MKGEIKMTHSIYWLIILAVLIFIEIITLGLTTIWFAAGALVAFILSLFFNNLPLEIISFILVSIAMYYFTRPLVLKYFNPKRIKTNYNGVIGKQATVLYSIGTGNMVGKVTVDGQEWTAKSQDGTSIDKGAKVIVQSISGAKLIVKKDNA